MLENLTGTQTVSAHNTVVASPGSTWSWRLRPIAAFDTCVPVTLRVCLAGPIPERSNSLGVFKAPAASTTLPLLASRITTSRPADVLACRPCTLRAPELASPKTILRTRIRTGCQLANVKPEILGARSTTVGESDERFAHRVTSVLSISEKFGRCSVGTRYTLAEF